MCGQVTSVVRARISDGAAASHGPSRRGPRGLLRRESGVRHPADPHAGRFLLGGHRLRRERRGGGAVGYGLDAWLHTTPWLSFVGLAFGIVSAVLLCVAQLRKFT